MLDPVDKICFVQRLLNLQYAQYLVYGINELVRQAVTRAFSSDQHAIYLIGKSLDESRYNP